MSEPCDGNCSCAIWRDRHEAAMALYAEVGKRKALEADVARLREALESIAEYDCTYGDNCPTFGTRHGQCVGCKARAALKEHP